MNNFDDDLELTEDDFTDDFSEDDAQEDNETEIGDDDFAESNLDSSDDEILLDDDESIELAEDEVIADSPADEDYDDQDAHDGKHIDDDHPDAAEIYNQIESEAENELEELLSTDDDLENAASSKWNINKGFMLAATAGMATLATVLYLSISGFDDNGQQIANNQAPAPAALQVSSLASQNAMQGMQPGNQPQAERQAQTHSGISPQLAGILSGGAAQSGVTEVGLSGGATVVRSADPIQDSFQAMPRDAEMPISNQSSSDDFAQTLSAGHQSALPAAIQTETAQKSEADNEVANAMMRAIEALQAEIRDLRGNLVAGNVGQIDAEVKGEAAGSEYELSDPRHGRTRIKGFKVINATADGNMTVVQTPSGRVNVYFEGETFRADGKTATVQGIANDGLVVLVDNNRFIDEIHEPLPPRPPRSPSQRQNTQPEVSAVASQAELPPANAFPPAPAPVFNDQTVSVVTAGGDVVIESRIAQGWNLNANMAQGYLVKDPLGVFKLVRQGDVLEGLGVVEGMDRDGYLRVGIYKIPRG